MAVILGSLGARWGMITMDDTALRDDVLFSEMLTSTHSEVNAAALATHVEQATRQRHCELVPDTLQIDVSDARNGTLHVTGAGLQIQGKAPTMIQDIDIRFDCRRPGVFFVKTVAKYRLRTQSPSDGRANHWPRRAGEEAAPAQ